MGQGSYSQIEIESAYSGIWSNHIYLSGLPKFTVWTDQKPLILLHKT